MHIAMSKTGPSKTWPVVVWWSRHPINNCKIATPRAEQNKTRRGDLVQPRDSAKRKKKYVTQAAIGPMLATRLAEPGVRTLRKWVCKGKELNPNARKCTKYVVPEKNIEAAVRSVGKELVVTGYPN